MIMKLNKEKELLKKYEKIEKLTNKVLKKSMSQDEFLKFLLILHSSFTEELIFDFENNCLLFLGK